jgi:serine/threonine protein kinase
MLAHEEDLTGSVIDGRYRVEKLLGEGGMGSVWLVRHQQSLERFALKTLHLRSARDQMSLERFLREARSAAALQSKHVVRIVDARIDHVDARGNKRPFLVMELLQGNNLEQVIRAAPLTPAQTVWVLQQIARALDLAHKRGIIHRDLKPENVFVTRDEDGVPLVKLCDFGIAKLQGDAAEGLVSTGAMGTQVGSTIGTPMYMAPEQARNSTDVVPASDQWAIGLIAFRALSGREYFAGARSTADLLLRIVNDSLPAPSQCGLPLGAAMDAWFLRSVARSPSDRWPSVGEQVAALRKALDVTEPVPVEPLPDTHVLQHAPTLPEQTPPPNARVAVQSLDTIAASARTQKSSDHPPTPGPERARRRPWLWTIPVVGLAAIGALAYARIGTSSTPQNADARSVDVPLVASTAAATPAPSTTSITAVSPAISAMGVVDPAASTLPTTTATIKQPSSVSSGVAVAKPTAAKSVTLASTTAAVTAATTPPPPPAVTTAAPPKKLASGAACERNTECASGECVALSCK